MRFINDHLLPLFAAALLVIATSCWFALPEPGQPKTATLATEPWQLPELPARDSAAAIQAITARSLWGATAADIANAPPPPPKWNVLGIVRNGSERFVLLAYEGSPVAQLNVGDSLPDGMKIVQIDNTRFFVMTDDKKKLIFEIYKNEPTK